MATKQRTRKKHQQPEFLGNSVTTSPKNRLQQKIMRTRWLN